jgi:hexulose-6-phosphate isomerase
MNTSDADVRALRRKVEDAGLTVSDVANSLDWDENISARDPRIRENALRHVERQIETAQLLGTDSTLVVAGLVTAEIPYNEVYVRTIESLKTLGEKAAKARVKIGCENCCAEQRFLITPREFWQFTTSEQPRVGIHPTSAITRPASPSNGSKFTGRALRAFT